MPARTIVYIKAGITSVLIGHPESHLSFAGILRGSGMGG